MSLLFGKQKTQKEIISEQKKGIQRNQRDLDKDLLTLDRNEKQITAEIKKLAKQNQMGSAKILAKELVRIRTQREKIYNMKATLSGVSMRTTTMGAQVNMTKSMATASKSLGVMNAATSGPQMQRVMQEYSKQSEMADMKQEMMDDILDQDVDDEEVDDVTNALLDEIGLDVSAQMSKARTPGSKLPTTAQTAEDRELQKLLQSLP